MQKKADTYKEIAEAFIKAFVQKRYQERYLFLLSKGGDRWEKGVDELRRSDRYTTQKLESLPKEFSYEDMESQLRKHGASKEAFVISKIEDMDGKYVDLSYAIQCLDYSQGGIISCIPGKLAFVINEDGCERFILKKEG